ncbi:hypothetical protein CLOM_g17994 [Closterium sp. NIES-68]|nr:hypothetical protein CLOM_g17994 [Closterium sp. NIES-68]GJP70119.1 hypothetical protein CLOP_g1101 [Closterium sp. NIES-67]
MVRFPFDLDRGWVLHQRTGRLEDIYTLEEELGRGHFGIVKLCRKRSGGGQYACKSINKSKLSHWEDKEDVRREIEIMRRLAGNPYTLNLEDVFEDDKCVHLIMELCEGGDLFDDISSHGFMTETQAAAVFEEIVLAVMHCHEHGVLHRDLKPENILLVRRSGVRTPAEADDCKSPTRSFSLTPRVKLTDFGLSLFVDAHKQVYGVAGSPFYLAPEVLSGNYGHQADIWSLGVMLYMLLSGSAPFFGETEDEVLAAVKRGKFSFYRPIWGSISPFAKDLIRCLLRQDPAKRPTASDILQHPWFTEVFRSQQQQQQEQEQEMQNDDSKQVVDSLDSGFSIDNSSQCICTGAVRGPSPLMHSLLPSSPVSHLQCAAEFSPVVSRKLPHVSPQTPPRLVLETPTSLLCASSRLCLSSSLGSALDEASVAADGARSERIGGSESAAGGAAADVQEETLDVAPSLWGLFGGYRPMVKPEEASDFAAAAVQTPQSLSCSTWGRSQATDAVEIDWVFGF